MRYDGWLLFMMVFLSSLIFFQVVVKVVLYRRVTFVLERVETLLRISETHAEINDAQKERTIAAIDSIKSEAKQAANIAAAVVKESTEEVKNAVAEVPTKVIEKIQETVPESAVMKRPNLGTSEG